jgi:hypothetical protein
MFASLLLNKYYILLVKRLLEVMCSQFNKY